MEGRVVFCFRAQAETIAGAGEGDVGRVGTVFAGKADGLHGGDDLFGEGCQCWGRRYVGVEDIGAFEGAEAVEGELYARGADGGECVLDDVEAGFVHLS